MKIGYNLCIIISELENYFTLDMIENEKTKISSACDSENLTF